MLCRHADELAVVVLWEAMERVVVASEHWKAVKLQSCASHHNAIELAALTVNSQSPEQ